MRKKCPICKGCMGGSWYINRLFYYCTLCKKVYGLACSELYLVDEPGVTNYFISLYGNTV